MRISDWSSDVCSSDLSQFQAVLPVSTFCAVYHPWIRVFDPTVADTVVVPPAGHVAGVYARTDIQRGVHKAPENEALRGLYLREIGNERTISRMINRQRHDVFNPANRSDDRRVGKKAGGTCRSR